MTKADREPMPITRLLEGEGICQPSGAYSLAVGVGGLLFLAGQAPYNADGVLRRGSISEQVQLVFANLDNVARAAGGRLSDAVRLGVYLRDLADFDEMDTACRAWFKEQFPARTTIQSSFADFDVEIDAVVALRSPDERR